MTILSAKNLGKSYAAQVLFADASVALRESERVGLVGHNGSGKSTLARILAGLETPDAGTIDVRRGAKIRLLEQQPRFEPGITVRAAVMAGLNEWLDAKTRYETATDLVAKARDDASLKHLLHEQMEASAAVERQGGWDITHRVESILSKIGLRKPDACVDELSGGDRRRVALAQILILQPELAILDEPSNHLDLQTIEWLEQFLVEEYAGAVLFITHDRFMLDRVAARTLELDGGKLFDYEGGYEAYLEAKAERLALEARTESNRQNTLRRELEWLRRQPKARTGKQKARIQRAEALQVERGPGSQAVPLDFSFASHSDTRTIFELRNVGLVIDDRRLLDGFNLVLMKGERIGIIGPNGIGKTSLLRLVAGTLAPSSGEALAGAGMRAVFFDQLRQDLEDDASIFDNVAKTFSAEESSGKPLDVRSYLIRFSFSPSKQQQPVGSLSGGERARAALAKVLSRSANLMLLDEPTNDLDVATLAELEHMLLEFDGCSVVVTHDRFFLNRVATSILAFDANGKITRYAGNYDDYLRQRSEISQAEEPRAGAVFADASRPKAVSQPPRSKGLTYKERIELDGILDQIEQSENRVRDLEAQLTDTSTYAKRGEAVAGIVAALDSAKLEATQLVARWEELETKREQSAKGDRSSN